MSRHGRGRANACTLASRIHQLLTKPEGGLLNLKEGQRGNVTAAVMRTRVR
jgi:hypothetical protein